MRNADIIKAMQTDGIKPQKAGSNSATLELAREIARNYIALVRAHFGNRLRAARLFGSAARGDWSPDSDVDILVLLDVVTARDEDWLVSKAFRMGMMDAGIMLQPIFMTYNEFERLTARERRFALDVQKDGVPL